MRNCWGMSKISVMLAFMKNKGPLVASLLRAQNTFIFGIKTRCCEVLWMPHGIIAKIIFTEI
jgi:hypothetical protein